MSTNYRAEQNLMELPAASPDSNSELERSSKGAARSHGSRWLGVGGLLFVSLAIIGFVAGTNKHTTEERSLDTLRSLEETISQLPGPVVPGSPGIPVTLPATPPSICSPPTEGGPCNTEASYQQCLAVEATGCLSVAASRACPPRYICLEKTEAVPDLPIVTPTINHCSTHAPAEGSSCDTDASYQECLQLQEEGCEMILSTYSCPPQFRCGDAPTPVQPIEPAPEAIKSTPISSNGQGASLNRDAVTLPTGPTSTSQCIKSPCDTDESQMQCLSLEAQGCIRMKATRSCPPQYSCGEFAPASPVQPVQPIETQCIAPDGCQTEASYQQCRIMESAGCTQMISTASCPPTYGCATPPEPVQPVEPAPESQCQAPSPDVACVSEESYQQCIQLEASGCQTMIATASCPPMYSCAIIPAAPAPPTQTRKAEPLTGLSTPTVLNRNAAPVHKLTPFSRKGNSPNYCQLPNEVDDACYSEQSYQQCLGLANAGCQQIASHRSCPIQYLCFDKNY